MAKFFKVELSDSFGTSGIAYINEDYCVLIVPADKDEEGCICKIMGSNGMVFKVTKLPQEYQEWTRREW